MQISLNWNCLWINHYMETQYNIQSIFNDCEAYITKYSQILLLNSLRFMNDDSKWLALFQVSHDKSSSSTVFQRYNILMGWQWNIIWAQVLSLSTILFTLFQVHLLFSKLCCFFLSDEEYKLWWRRRFFYALIFWGFPKANWVSTSDFRNWFEII